MGHDKVFFFFFLCYLVLLQLWQDFEQGAALIKFIFFKRITYIHWDSVVAQKVKSLLSMQETWVLFLG